MDANSGTLATTIHRSPMEVNNGSQLPPYSHTTPSSSSPEASSRERIEHTLMLNDRKSNPWATLTFYSSARSSQHMPTFMEDEAIVGSVFIRPDKIGSITNVSITIKGRIVAGSSTVDQLIVSDSYTFLKDTHVLWTKSKTNPRTTSPSQFTAETGHGEHLTWGNSWPFSFIIPQEVTLSPTSSAPPATYRMPQTFSDKVTTASIQYELVLDITRTFLRPNDNLRTFFAYIPFTRPGVPSIRRCFAYHNNIPLDPPENDPEGWKTLRSVTMRGTIFTTRYVRVQCSLSLATPLSYTRGTVIPLFLTLSSDDTQALDLLLSKNSIDVRLCRRIRYHMFASHATNSKETGAGWKDTYKLIDKAVWWPMSDGAGDSNSRRINGEIRLSKDLVPSTSIAHFTVGYSVVMMPFETTAFVSLHMKDEPLLSESVEVATSLAPGPVPKAYAPPGYHYGESEASATTFGAPHGLFNT